MTASKRGVSVNLVWFSSGKVIFFMQSFFPIAIIVIAILLSSLFSDQKASLMDCCMGTYLLNGRISGFNLCRKQVN